MPSAARTLLLFELPQEIGTKIGPQNINISMKKHRSSEPTVASPAVIVAASATRDDDVIATLDSLFVCDTSLSSGCFLCL